jgi:hypothetical protein
MCVIRPNTTQQGEWVTGEWSRCQCGVYLNLRCFGIGLPELYPTGKVCKSHFAVPHLSCRMYTGSNHTNSSRTSGGPLVRSTSLGVSPSSSAETKVLSGQKTSLKSNARKCLDFETKLGVPSPKSLTHAVVRRNKERARIKPADRMWSHGTWYGSKAKA